MGETSTCPPLGVNFTAFETKFHTTCWIRTLSHTAPLAEGSSRTFNVTPRASAAVRVTLTPAFDHLRQLAGLDIHAQFAGDDSRHVQYVID